MYCENTHAHKHVIRLGSKDQHGNDLRETTYKGGLSNPVQMTSQLSLTMPVTTWVPDSDSDQLSVRFFPLSDGGSTPKQFSCNPCRILSSSSIPRMDIMSLFRRRLLCKERLLSGCRMASISSRLWHMGCGRDDGHR